MPAARKIYMIQPKAAVTMISKGLENSGFIRVSSSAKGSKYFGKIGTHKKIRVSDHRDPYKNDDVIHDEVVDCETISSDVDFRLKRAIVAFDHATRKERKRK